MRIETPEIQTLTIPPLLLGECPVWDAIHDCVYFIDIKMARLYRLAGDGASLQHWDMPATIGSFGLCQDHRIVVALRDGIKMFDPLTGSFRLMAQPELHVPNNRLNDGKVGPDGCFWVGSMDDRPERAETAALYRMDQDGGCRKVVDGLRVSNGLAWSLDGRKMYHADTRHEWVRVYDFDCATGALANARDLCRLDDSQGRPDGGAMDVEGYYWSAGVTAGCLNRIAPDGRIERKLILPMPAPTMPCFGGTDMKTLFVTSLAKDGQPGTMISLQLDVPGVAVGRFGPI